MGPDVPLLNDYKQEFFWKRFPQTILGGPRFKLGYCAPPYIYVNQVILFLIPWVFGGVGTVLYQLNTIDDCWASVLAAGLMLLAACIVQGMSLWVRQKNVTVETFPSENTLADEDEFDFSSCAGPETVKFIVPGKKYLINTVFHSVLAGALCGLGTLYLLPNRLMLLYANAGATFVLFVFGWVTVCIGEYSLIINTAVETATFQPQDTYEINALTRPLYIFVFIAVDLAYRFTVNPILLQINQILHIIFVFLPVVWAVGVLPPVDALFLWVLEQVLEFGLGGSPMATNLRLLAMFVVSVGVVIATFFIPSTLGVVLFTTGMGFILSLDLSQADTLFRFCCRTAHASLEYPKYFGKRIGWHLGWKEALIYISLLIVTLAEAGLLHFFAKSSSTFIINPQTVISYILIVTLVIWKIFQEIQGSYVLFGFFRNPLFPKGVRTVRLFEQKRAILMKFGFIQRILLNLISPFAMVAFLSVDTSLQDLHTVSLCIGFTRAFRIVWQNTENALLEVVVIAIVRLATVHSSLVWWNSIGTGIQLLMVGIIRDRFFQATSKLKFALTVLVSSWTEKKQRRKSSSIIITLNVILFPVVLTIIALASALSAPLLPLFTLPVFLVGFPRPSKTWPGSVGAAACICPDSVYYQHMMHNLANAFSTAFSAGSLGNPSPGSHFLCRFQDRLMWVLVLERGFGYCCISIKGLELQETSCHTAEARRVDEVFEMAFEQEDQAKTCPINQHLGNILTPCAVLPVEVYSDARNILTGIIDTHENLKQIKEDFAKVFIWVLLRSTNKSKSCQNRQDIQPLQQNRTWSDECTLTSVQTESSTSPKDSSINSETFNEWSDGDIFELESIGRKTRISLVKNMIDMQQRSTKPIVTCIPGSLETRSLSPDINEELPKNTPTYGLPAIDKGEKRLMGSGNREIAPLVVFSSPYSSKLKVPENWRSGPFPSLQLQKLLKSFPDDWYSFVLTLMDVVQSDEKSSIIFEVKGDKTLRAMYAQVVMSCYGIMLGTDSTIPSPNQVFKVYSGDIPWSLGLDWLTQKPELLALALKAFRYTFKLMFDKASLGPVEDFVELVNYLEEYERDWFIGMMSESEWQQAVLQEKPYLFSLGYDPSLSTYTGRVLSLQEMLLQVGRLNAEAIRGQWANLSWELLYATNDDEERYSIQAHPVLLRNLTVQSADPPLGYPIYSSTPIHVPLL
ncbi:pecanex-like protein 4 [Stegostoma tigrinum]|uniref:pecanex-like protein 4 n=1 Tax=Stegostoma tigrinum TaxID=3053191 RepID=UPI00202B4DEF|nr:pecanex-like protein 4 [Stegostoma tigrinum]XP_048393248.1 pecanex-like protein 4 [Stegostoma tigrinum]XP_048393249.1 pecanex-like protein 4 [Stegostoma tigrinum]